MAHVTLRQDGNPQGKSGRQHGEEASHESLLTLDSYLGDIPFDVCQRYMAVARILDRFLANVSAPLRLLEIGCSAENVLLRLLDPRRVQVTRCHWQARTDDSEIFLLPDCCPLPMADNTFDAVIALDVIAEIPSDRRRRFLAECERVARYGIVFSSPKAIPEVREAEAAVAAAYRERHQAAHPVLSLHQAYGLPTAEEFEAILREFDRPYVAFDNSPVDSWLAMSLLSESLEERSALARVHGLLNRPLLSGQLSASSATYRRIYVYAKTFDATMALEPSFDPSLESSGVAALADARSPLQCMSIAAAEAIYHLASANQDYEEFVRDLRCEIVEWRQQHLLHYWYIHSLTHSAFWKLTQPLRALRRLLRPRGFNKSALLPFNDLDHDRHVGPGGWISTGKNPSFVIPCHLPAGPLQIRLKLTSEVEGVLAITGITGSGIDDLQYLKRAAVQSHLEVDEIVQLRKPVLGIQLNPLNVEGSFQIEQFDVKPMRQAITSGAWWSKLLPWVSLQKSRKIRKVEVETPGDIETVQVEVQPASRLDRVHLEARTKRSRTDEVLDVVYVLKEVGRCGGVKVVMEHVSRLRERGHNACIYHLAGSGEWFGRPAPLLKFDNEEQLKDALAKFRGIKVATWYETAPWVAASLRRGDQGYYLIQDIEESYCTNKDEAMRALDTYSLGLKPISEGTWVRDQLKQRFGLSPVHVSIGLDFSLFQPRPLPRKQHYILAQARTWSGGGAMGAHLKGWDTLLKTMSRCQELNPYTNLTTFSMEEKHAFSAGLRHTHFRTPCDSALAELYSRAGLYLLTSNHEGFGLTAAEAMACGCPVVATFASGNEEFCIDGYTALMAPAGDAELLAQQCVRLQKDPAFAAELGRNGHQFIRNYTWDRVIDRVEKEFLQRPRPQTIRIGKDVSERSTRASDDSYPNLHLSEEPALDWSIVIPTVRDAQRVYACVSSCRDYLPANGSVEFIVVDDGTQNPEVLEELRKAAGDLGFKLLLNHQNLGFSASVNHGMRHARGRYVVLCNNDILFFQPWLEQLEKAFEANPEVGIIGAKLLYPNGSIQHAGVEKVPGQLQWYHAFCRLPVDHPRANRSRQVWAVTGALFAVRRETLRTLGGLSTAYGTAYEDLDYCLHAWNTGIRVAYCADVVAYHLEGGTRGATLGQKMVQSLNWAERERAGSIYFEKRWAALCHQESFEALFYLSKRGGRPAAAKPADEQPSRTPVSV